MIVPIVKIPSTIADGLRIYRNLFSRSETYRHIEEYCTGLVVLDKPSIQRMSRCLVNGPPQSSLNKAITCSPWSEAAVNQRRIESIAPYHQTGFTVGIVDSTFIHHPRGQSIVGVYKYWDYVENRYTYAIQLVTAAVSTGVRLDAFDYRIYHCNFETQEQRYLRHTAVADSQMDKVGWGQRLAQVVAYQATDYKPRPRANLPLSSLTIWKKAHSLPTLMRLIVGYLPQR